MTLDILPRARMCPCELVFSRVQQSKADAGPFLTDRVGHKSGGMETKGLKNLA